MSLLAPSTYAVCPCACWLYWQAVVWAIQGRFQHAGGWRWLGPELLLQVSKLGVQSVAAGGMGPARRPTLHECRPALLWPLFATSTGQCTPVGWYAPPKAPLRQQLRELPPGQLAVLLARAPLLLAQGAALEVWHTSTDKVQPHPRLDTLLLGQVYPRKKVSSRECGCTLSGRALNPTQALCIGWLTSIASVLFTCEQPAGVLGTLHSGWQVFHPSVGCS